MPETRKPDAIFVPRTRETEILTGKIGRRYDPNADLARAYNEAFRDVLNPETAPTGSRTGDPLTSRRSAVRVRDSGGYRFLSLDPKAFPRDGAKQSYYRWEEQSSGVLYGYLLSPDVPPYPSVGPAPLPPAPPGGATFETTITSGEED